MSILPSGEEEGPGTVHALFSLHFCERSATICLHCVSNIHQCTVHLVPFPIRTCSRKTLACHSFHVNAFSSTYIGNASQMLSFNFAPLLSLRFYYTYFAWIASKSYG